MIIIMINEVNKMEVIYLILGFFLIVFSVFGLKYLSICEKKVQNSYKLERKRMNLKKMAGKKNPEPDNDEVEDFIESLPGWLKGVADGANIDLEAVFYGDQEELNKVKQVLDKNLQNNGGQGGFL